MHEGVSLRLALRDLANIVSARPWEFGAVCLIWLALSVPSQYLFDDGFIPLVFRVLLAPIVVLLSIWITPGIVYLTIRAASGEDWSLRDSFRGGNWIGRYLGIAVLMAIPLVVMMLVSFMVVMPIATSMLEDSGEDLNAEELSMKAEELGEEIAVELWPGLIFLGIGWTLVSTGFGFSWYLAIDKAMGIASSVKYSFQLLRGAFPQVFVPLAVLYVSNTVISELPGLGPLGAAVSCFVWVPVTLLLAILYRDRIRQWEAELGRPFRHYSMVSLPPEEQETDALSC